MTYRGHIRNGVVVLDEAVDLPEGTEVTVVTDECGGQKTLADQLRDVIGRVPDLPEDFAQNHDFYIHGTPKK